MPDAASEAIWRTERPKNKQKCNFGREFSLHHYESFHSITYLHLSRSGPRFNLRSQKKLQLPIFLMKMLPENAGIKKFTEGPYF